METQRRPKLSEMMDTVSKMLIDDLAEHGPAALAEAYMMAAQFRELPSMYYIGKTYCHLLPAHMQESTREMVRINDLMESDNPPPREEMEAMVAASIRKSLERNIPGGTKEQYDDAVHRMMKTGPYAPKPAAGIEAALRQALGIPDHVQVKVLGNLDNLPAEIDGLPPGPGVEHNTADVKPGDGNFDLRAFGGDGTKH